MKQCPTWGISSCSARQEILYGSWRVTSLLSLKKSAIDKVQILWASKFKTFRIKPSFTNILCADILLRISFSLNSCYFHKITNHIFYVLQTNFARLVLYMTEQVGSNGNASDLYSEVVQFKSRLEHHISRWLKCFFQSLQANDGIVPSVSTEQFLCLSQFISHHSLCIWCYLWIAWLKKQQINT
jgi:hypothetical protein